MSSSVARLTTNVLPFMLALAITIFDTAAAMADNSRRLALLVGNSEYAFAPLQNPVNDAQDLGRRLKSLGFETAVLTDPDRDTLQKSIAAFYRKVAKHPDSLSLFYYAGHAVQINNVNYLIPVDVSMVNQDRLLQGSISISELFAAMEKDGGHQNLIILDACRNNPFAGITSADVSRGVELPDDALRELPSGLAPVEAPAGTLIAYATAPGSVASDGDGRNGTYTKHLLKYLDEHQPVEEVFKRVREGVVKETDAAQIPWEHSSLIGRTYFNPPRNSGIPSIGGF